MGKFVFTFLICNFCNGAFAADFHQHITEETGLIEEQAQLACGSQNDNKIKNTIAERLFDRNGVAMKLVNQLNDHASQAGYDMDHIEETVIQPIWQKERDEAKTQLDQAVTRLNSVKRRPASEQLRDQVREAYGKYRSLDQTSGSLSPEVEQKIKRYKRAKMDELKFASTMSDRLHHAISQAVQCHCKNSGTQTCYSIEEMQSSNELKKALHESRTADEIKHEVSALAR